MKVQRLVSPPVDAHPASGALPRPTLAVLEASPNPIVAIDEAGRISYVNPRVADTFGYARDELLGETVEILLPANVAARHVAHRDGFLASPFVRPMGIGMELAGRRKDGSEFPIDVSLFPVETPDGPRVFATIFDITARKSAENQLLQAQKLESIGRLAGGIAHDFNNMLFAIKGYAELLADDLAPANRARLDPDEALTNVEAIGAAATRAASLTAQLLAFSRQQVVRPEVLELNDAIEAVEPMLRRLIGANLGLVVRQGRDAGRLLAGRGQLDQILVNLVINARDAMPDGGTITIESGNVELDGASAAQRPNVTPGRYVYLAVGDTGVGMDSVTRDHAFEPFFTTKAKGKGTGLGLATIYGTVQQAGGHIWLDSEPGMGSSFMLYFPRVDAPVSVTPSPPPARAIAETGTVMVVEDESSVRDMTSIVLRRAGYQVTAVGDGAEAIERLTGLAEPVDVLVTDVVMPGMSGIDLAERALDLFPGAGVVLLSGYTAETLDLDRVVTRGALFLSKPVTSNDLLDAVRLSRVRRSALDDDLR